MDTITAQGDMKGHTEAQGGAYRKLLGETPQAMPPHELLGQGLLGEIILRNFLKWARRQNITVVGGLPTVFNDLPI